MSSLVFWEKSRSQNRCSFPLDRAIPTYPEKGPCTPAILTGFIANKTVIFENGVILEVSNSVVDAFLQCCI
jgi:hypothetical protein